MFGKPADFTGELILWAVLVAAVELLPVPAWRGLHLSVGFPLLMVVAMLYAPIAAGAVAFAGASDPRELRGEVDFLRAIFNRCQVALSVFAASAVFHGLANIDISPTWLLIAAATLAALADYAVNSGMVTIFTSIRVHMHPGRVIRELRIRQLGGVLGELLGPGTAWSDPRGPLPTGGCLGLPCLLGATAVRPPDVLPLAGRWKRRTRSCRSASRSSSSSRTRSPRSVTTNASRSPTTCTTTSRRCCSGSRSRSTSPASSSTRATSRRWGSRSRRSGRPSRTPRTGSAP